MDTIKTRLAAIAACCDVSHSAVRGWISRGLIAKGEPNNGLRTLTALDILKLAVLDWLRRHAALPPTRYRTILESLERAWQQAKRRPRARVALLVVKELRHCTAVFTVVKHDPEIPEFLIATDTRWMRIFDITATEKEARRIIRQVNRGASPLQIPPLKEVANAA